MPEPILQRCVFPAEPHLRPLYYRTEADCGETAPEIRAQDRLTIFLPRGATLRTDTYLNTFFESYWRRFTTLNRLVLRLDLAGEGEVRLIRRVHGGPPAQVLQTIRFSERNGPLALDVPAPVSRLEASALHFEITAATGVLLRRADWRAPGASFLPVRLAVGLCTFNRPAFLLANLKALRSDPEVAGRVSQVVIVDQGTVGVRGHPVYDQLAALAPGQWRLMEQANFGGAGGFTRAILEARQSGQATHVLLMDDDLTVETESIFRLVALFSLARATPSRSADQCSIAGRQARLPKPERSCSPDGCEASLRSAAATSRRPRPCWHSSRSAGRITIPGGFSVFP